MKFKLVCKECGYETASVEEDDFDIFQELLNHPEWCENGGEHKEEKQ